MRSAMDSGLRRNDVRGLRGHQRSLKGSRLWPSRPHSAGMAHLGGRRLVAFGRHVHAVEPRRVEAEDLGLDVERQLGPRLARRLVVELEGGEVLDQPFRRVDAVVGAEEKPVRPEEEEQVGHHRGDSSAAACG